MNLFTLMGKIAVDNSEANKGIDDTTKRASGASSSIGGSLSKIGTTVSNMGKTVSNAGQYVQDFSSNMLNWGKSGATGKAAVAGIASVTALLAGSIPSAIKRLDTLNNSSKVFANMGFSAKDTSKAMTYLQDGIKGLPTPLNEAVTGLQMISSATNNVQVGAQVFTAINHAVLGFGGSTEQVSNATIQLSQAFSNGKIDAQTWISMMQSQMGPTLNAMAKQMGISTGELKEGLSSGKISVEDFEKSLTELDQKGGGGIKSLKQIAADNMGGIGTGIANLKIAVTRGMADILSAIGSTNISSAISNFGTSIEQALNGIANSIKVVVAYVQANSSWLMPIIKGAAGAVGGLVALKGVAILLTPVISTLGSGIKILGGIITVLTSPLGLIIGVITLVAGAMYAFFTKTSQGQQVWQQLVDFFNGTVVPMFNNLKPIIDNVVQNVMNGFQNAGTVVQSVMQTIGDFIMLHWDQIQIAIQLAMGVINAVIQTGVMIWQTLILPVVQTIVSFIQQNWGNISVIIQTVMFVVAGIIATAVILWQNAILPVLTIIFSTVSSVFNSIMTVISGVLNIVVGIIRTVMAVLSGNWTGAWNGIVQILSGVWQIISGVVSAAINTVKGVISAAWSAISGVTSSVWNAIKGVISGVWNGIHSTISGIIHGISSTISGVWNGIRSVTSSVWNGIKNAMTSPIQAAVGVVRGIIDTIKSLFNFHISFPAIKIPHIPLPHFSVGGGFDLKEWAKGRGIPHLNIDWYAKGGLMTNPTMFGMNGNNAMVGGEAGDEAILPLENQSVISRIAGAITDKMKLATDTDKNVEVNQYITMPATETPREFARRTTDEFVKVFKKA